MRRPIRSVLIVLGMSIAFGASSARADGFWSFDEQWWKDALANRAPAPPSERFVPTASTSVMKSAYSFLDDYSPN